MSLHQPYVRPIVLPGDEPAKDILRDLFAPILVRLLGIKQVRKWLPHAVDDGWKLFASTKLIENFGWLTGLAAPNYT